MPKKRYVTQKVWVVVTTEDSLDGDSDRFVDVVLLTPDKKKAERCVEVLIGDEYKDKPDKDALLAKDLKAIPGTIPYDTLALYESAGCFQRTIKEEF